MSSDLTQFKHKLETKSSPRRQCSTGRILSRAYAAIREWSYLQCK